MTNTNLSFSSNPTVGSHPGCLQLQDPIQAGKGEFECRCTESLAATRITRQCARTGINYNFNGYSLQGSPVNAHQIQVCTSKDPVLSKA